MKKNENFDSNLIFMLILIVACIILLLANFIIRSNIKDLDSKLDKAAKELFKLQEQRIELLDDAESLFDEVESAREKVLPQDTSTPANTPKKQNTAKLISRGVYDRTAKVTKADLENSKKLNMIATAYDLSVGSCGKLPSHPNYGITFSGERVIKGYTVAVDPSFIPLRSILYIEFPYPYASMDGIYKAMDTGSAIKNNKIDIYMGENARKECFEFGVQNVIVYVL